MGRNWRTRTQIVRLKNQQNNPRHLAQELDQILQQPVPQCVANDLLLGACAARCHAPRVLLREDRVVAPRDRAREQRKVLVFYPRRLVRVPSHTRLVCVQHCEPEFCVRATQPHGDVAVEPVVVEDDVEVGAAPAIRVMADSNVAAVGVAVQGRVGAKDHFVEDAGEGCRDLVAVDVVGVEVGEVVRACARDKVHDEDAALGPHNLWDDDGRRGDMGEVGARAGCVAAFEGEVEFLRERGLHFLRQPGEVVFGEPALEGAEGEGGEGQVELGPFVEGRVLDLDGDLLAVGGGGAVDLGERCGANGALFKLGEEV